MVSPLDTHHLLTALDEPGCAICTLLQKDATRYLASILHENATDGPTQMSFRKTRGLCNQHAWELEQHRGNALSMAILEHAAIDEVINQIDSYRKGDRGFEFRIGARDKPVPLTERLEPQARCPICEVMDRFETIYLQQLLKIISAPEVEQQYRQSHGLCLPHVRHLLKLAQEGEDDSIHDLIVDIQLAIWLRLQRDIQGFIEKMDHNRKESLIDEERQATKTVIRMLTGEGGVFGLRRWEE